jgi:RNA polymerase sigma-70 factor (ECF subfamily)
MLESSPHEVTVLLKAWSAGDESAREKLVQVVHRELHSMARRYMAGERPSHTLQPTALVNELYLQLVNTREMDWQNRAHFFAMCAQLMRRILTDFARSHRSLKRGGGAAAIPLDESLLTGRDSPAEFVALDDALNALTVVDERKSQVVELRFFGGLSVQETAEVLKVSPETVLRDWRLAKMWLLREMSPEQRHAGRMTGANRADS